MYEAVVDDMERWLALDAGEISPRVAAYRRHDAILLSPWVDVAVTAVELRIEPAGYGSAVTVLAYGDVPQLSDETRRRIRYRLGRIFGAALRLWVDEPHD
jgi:transposase